VPDGFVAGGLIWPWLAAPLPERFGRKVVCVVQMAVLIVLHLPFMGGVAGGILAVFAALALAWSFGRDIIWLWRVRGGDRAWPILPGWLGRRLCCT